jgi:hypothetical protein
MAYVRTVPTVSGAVAVQVVRKHLGQWEIGPMSGRPTPMLSWGFCLSVPSRSPPVLSAFAISRWRKPANASMPSPTGGPVV